MRLLGWLGGLFRRSAPKNGDRRLATGDSHKDSSCRSEPVPFFQRGARAYRDRFVPALQVTRLEPRCVLNAGPIPTHAVLPPPSPQSQPPSTGTNPNVLVVAAADMLNHPPQ